MICEVERLGGEGEIGIGKEEKRREQSEEKTGERGRKGGGEKTK